MRSRGGPYTKLSDALIQAEGDAVSGASYTYTDNDVVKGVTNYYKLEDVDITASAPYHRPISATLSPIRRICLLLSQVTVNLNARCCSKCWPSSLL